MQNEYGSDIEEGLANPQETPQYTSGVNAINQGYAGAADNLTSQLAARGMGDSGAVGTGLQQLAVSKAGAVGNEANTVEDQFENEAQGFGFASPGSTKVSVGAGSAAAGGLGATLASLQSSLNAAGSGGGL